MNISCKGWLRFDHSKGEAGEAMVQESNKGVVILEVDASKSISNGKSLTRPRRPDRTHNIIME